MCIQARSTTMLLFIALIFSSCGDKKTKQEQQKPVIQVPEFNADSAYNFVERQVAFGPRIPNTKVHRLTGDFIVRKMRGYGAIVTEQEFQATTFDGERIALRNIIASFSPEKQKRIILAAHWDTRPFSDKDPEFPNKPFDGANDGASGVGVLMEIARHLHQTPEVGIDLIFFDGEDWGERNDAAMKFPTPEGLDSWYCLGSQYWSLHKHKPGYEAYYGILLDMVGGPNARFFQEGSSMMYASGIMEKVWSAAARLGYGSSFIRKIEEGIVDDHLFVNQLANIPMIDITPFDPTVGYFGTFHHTQQDNMTLISRETLAMVGRLVLQVVYTEE